jgi:alkylation response protein AidB-like acyl-CoA dehydrogenase
MTEPDAGSDLAGMKTTAVEAGDTVIINGSKTFISNGINCDLLVLAARDPAVEQIRSGVPVCGRRRHPGFHPRATTGQDGLAQPGYGRAVF